MAKVSQRGIKVSESDIHDFSRKLRQTSAINSLREYIVWQRNYRSQNTDIRNALSFPKFGPVSINLDLTTVCNYACKYCVDAKVLNRKEQFSFSHIIKTIDTLCNHGLKSVLLIGGGEPALHPKFTYIVRYLKKKRLQVGIVTNGSLVDRIVEISDCLGKGDWIRLSLDSGSDELFQAIHSPRVKVNLQDICNKLAKIKYINESIVIGCSYIITWRGIKINDVALPENIHEIPKAVELAALNNFDYISFKPCLLKTEDSNIESLFHCETEEFAKSISGEISRKIEEAGRAFEEKIQIVTTLNLKAVLSGLSGEFKNQPRNCHIQLFRAVVTPIGIFHCPAYRGDARTQIGSAIGYVDQDGFRQTVSSNYRNMLDFNAARTCKDIVCFYSRVNRWIETVIESDLNVMDIEECQDQNFFI